MNRGRVAMKAATTIPKTWTTSHDARSTSSILKNRCWNSVLGRSLSIRVTGCFSTALSTAAGPRSTMARSARLPDWPGWSAGRNLWRVSCRRRHREGCAAYRAPARRLSRFFGGIQFRVALKPRYQCRRHRRRRACQCAAHCQPQRGDQGRGRSFMSRRSSPPRHAWKTRRPSGSS